MATYTSTQNGNWNDVATWGGGGWPQNAGDLAIIGHTVTPNVSSTVELGTGASDAITINAGGILTFSRTVSTKLTIGHYDIQINDGGELRVGASGAIIPKAYTAELVWNTTADNAKGIDLAAGGKLTVYGDPDYFGSDKDTVLTAQAIIPAATNPITITVAGDFTSDGNAENITAMTRAADCSITWTLHGLTAGDKFTIAGVAQADWTALNGVQTVKAVTDANTITIETDTSGYAADYLNTDPGTYTRPKWKVGQELIVHKGGAYASYINDFCRLAITSVVANGANTDIATTVTERPAALTCAIGADVLNVSRNVLLYKLSYNANLGQSNTNRPRISNSNAIGTSNINVHDAMFGSWNKVVAGYGVVFDGVIRNGEYGATNTSLATISGIFLAVYYPIASTIYSTVNATIVGSNYGILDNTGCTFTGDVFGNANGWSRGINNIYSGNYYSNGLDACVNNASIITGKLGYNSADLAMANTADFNFNQGSGWGYGLTKLLNVKIQSTPTFSSRNSVLYRGRFCFEHYQQVANAHYIADAFGDITKTAADGTGDNPTQRSGGNADVIEAVPQSNCAAASYLELLNIRLWAAAGVSKTYRFYVQTDFATLPTAELKLYGEYLDEGSGGHLASATPSTQDITTRADADDWSQYVEVTINPAQTGYVNLYMRLMGYEAAKKVWVDPMVVITGGDAVTVTPYWSYGDVQLDVDPVGGGGVFPIIGGGHIIQPARAA